MGNFNRDSPISEWIEMIEMQIGTYPGNPAELVQKIKDNSTERRNRKNSPYSTLRGCDWK